MKNPYEEQILLVKSSQIRIKFFCIKSSLTTLYILNDNTFSIYFLVVLI